jgi:hypothetical protein
MRVRLVLVGMMALLLAPSVGAGEATAQAKTNCEARTVFEFSPGFWREGNTGTFTTGGETGTVTCDGPVNGKMPTGPGTYGGSGRYGTENPDDCANAEGDYQNSITIPTADGPQHLSNRGLWKAGAFQGGGVFGGTFTGETADGTFEVTPKEGDCVTKPLTKTDGIVRWTLK